MLVSLSMLCAFWTQMKLYFYFLEINHLPYGFLREESDPKQEVITGSVVSVILSLSWSPMSSENTTGATCNSHGCWVSVAVGGGALMTTNKEGALVKNARYTLTPKGDPKEHSRHQRFKSRDSHYACCIVKPVSCSLIFLFLFLLPTIPRACTTWTPFFLEVINQDVKSDYFQGLKSLLVVPLNLSTVTMHHLW